MYLLAVTHRARVIANGVKQSLTIKHMHFGNFANYCTFSKNLMKYKTAQVYILTNKNNTVLYTGVTNNLARRMHEHKLKLNPKSFASRYNVDKLVWFENYLDIVEAIAHEKQIKAGSRTKKVKLINEMNPDWVDLSDTLYVL